MARLVLHLDGQVLAEYNMSKERYTIGRLPDNDIRIDNAAVSGHHALIINILNDSFLEDLNSTNGTYVNGRLIKKHALAAGITFWRTRPPADRTVQGVGDLGPRLPGGGAHAGSRERNGRGKSANAAAHD